MKVLNDLQQAYITAALWSSCDDNGEPLDAQYNISDLADETLKTMMEDCDKFESMVMPILECTDDETRSECCKDWSDFGHDFWLTRNGHGSGFWDGDYPEKLGDDLTDAAHRFPECNLYIGDDKKIYIG